jgi:Domain of unknown function (DUF4864)
MRMDEPRDIPDAFDSNPSERSSPFTGDPSASGEAPGSPSESAATEVERAQAGEQWPAAAAIHENAIERRRNFRRNLFASLVLALVAFTLTSWILVRVDSPFGILVTGPQEVVRAQLRALDRGELKPAYDLFSARFRSHVSFDAWHELCISHWQMFHSNVVRADQPEPKGGGVFLEIYLRGADDTHYRARFTVIRANGRWWIDDVHWMQEPAVRETWRA